MSTQIHIGRHTVGRDSSDCFVIAEVGHNHGGNVEVCRQLFQAAKNAGVSAVKLQKRDNRALYTRQFYDSTYNSENAFGPTYGAHREALEFGESEYRDLKQFAESLDLVFFATAFDFPSVEFLERIDVPCYKVASGDLTHVPLLKAIAQTGKPLILSTGAGTLDDVKRAYDAIMPLNQQLAILHCTAEYPSDHTDMNLSVISTYGSRRVCARGARDREALHPQPCLERDGPRLLARAGGDAQAGARPSPRRDRDGRRREADL
jgi:N-acetylneuraminate synthase/sialic acid synthase